MTSKLRAYLKGRNKTSERLSASRKLILVVENNKTLMTVSIDPFSVLRADRYNCVVRANGPSFADALSVRHATTGYPFACFAFSVAQNRSRSLTSVNLGLQM